MRRAPTPATPAADGPAKPHRRASQAHRRTEFEIAETASAQHGLLTLDQLHHAGLTTKAVQSRIAGGRLHRVHLGVYAVGYRTRRPDSRRMAAVLTCGPGAVLSHRSAAALWGLRPDRPGAIDVTAPNRRGRSPAGIRAHRHASLVAADRTAVRNIPCTSVARTLLDFAGVATISELRGAVAEAEVRRILNVRAVETLIKRSRGRRGVARLRMLIQELNPRKRKSRSLLEQHFVTMCERAKLPPPEVNCVLDFEDEKLMPDFLWRDARLIVETDGRETHDTASAFQEDRRRDQIFSGAGWQVIRCTWHQVLNEPTRLAHTLRALLDLRRRD